MKPITWQHYIKHVHDDGRYFCHSCGTKLFTEKSSKTRIEKHKMKKEGEVGINTDGSKMILIEYIKSNNINVVFENGYIKNCTYDNFKKGLVKNYTSLVGIDGSYVGIGEYKTSINGKTTHQYNVWKGMLQRCYSKHFTLQRPTYDECTVCEEWHNFQVFAKWYDDNYYEINDKSMNLDKDILIKGNKVYSPETCCIVPSNINTLFIKCNSKRGNYPIGVYFQEGSYGTSCSNSNGSLEYLGKHKTPLLAFEAYKTYKEKLIKEIAIKYHGLIPENVYNALMKYEVEITD